MVQNSLNLDIKDLHSSTDSPCFFINKRNSEQILCFKNIKPILNSSFYMIYAQEANYIPLAVVAQNAGEVIITPSNISQYFIPLKI